MAKTQVPKSPTTTDYPHLGPYQDPTTARGKSQIVQVTVQEYLTQLGLWDDTTVQDLGPDVGVDCQRGVLGITTNKIKKDMFRHLLRGGILPPLVVLNKGKQWQVIDGLQRTSVIVEALRTIKLLEEGPETDIKKFAADIIEDMKKEGQKWLSSDDFLNLPVAMQLWSDLTREEWTDLFIILNTGQQKVNPRHLLEVDKHELLQIFMEWGIPVTTVRLQKDHPTPRGRKTDEVIKAETKEFPFDSLINGLIAYHVPEIGQHAKTSKTLHDKIIVRTNGEYCETDFKWVCIALNNIIRAKYGAKKGHNTLFNDTFYIPLMAAIGWARSDPTIMPQVESRQSDLIDLLDTSESSDPLVLEDPNRGFSNIIDAMKGSIGKKKRDMTYLAWKEYFRIGATNPSYPINWQEGKKLSS